MTDGPVSKNIQKLFFYEEPDRASFAQDHSGTLGDYTLIPHAEGSIDFDPGVFMVDPGQGVHHIYDGREKFPGHKLWSLTFGTPLAPGTTLGGDGVAAVAGPCAKLLKNVLGGIEIGTGTTVSVTWGDGVSGAVTSAAGLKAGMAIGFVISGRFYVREIKSVVGTTITLKVALPAAPQATDVVYGGVTIYLHRSPRAFAQFLVIGEEEDDRYILRGGFGTVQIQLAMTGEDKPMLTFTFEGRAWDYGEDGATDLSLLSFESEAYANYDPIPDHVGEFIEQAVGTSTLAVAAVKEVGFTLNLENRQITDPSAEEGLKHWMRVRTDAPTVQGNFMPTYYEDLTRQKRRDNRDRVYLAYTFGTTTTSGAVTLSASKVQYLASPPSESDGVGVESVEWEGRNDTDTVVDQAADTDLAVSCFRVHIFR